MKSIVPTFFFNFLFSIGLFCVSFYVAWQLSATTNFLFSMWYEVIDIESAVQKYAPHNNHRKGFERTNKQEQVRLFSEIVSGIQNNGKGLAQLEYSDRNNKAIDTLLTDAEVIHLTDVAKLINKFKYFAIAGILIAVLEFLLLFVCNIQFSKLRYHLIGGVGLVILLLIFVFIAGPTKVFYAGHDLIFPNQHQWFFYYEDSLMSTMMKAPALFGPIAAQLLILTICIWITFLYLANKLISHAFHNH